MLAEYKEVRQREGEGYRRWFSDAFFDVILWYDREGGAITGYQVCYDKGKSERAFTWKDEGSPIRSHRFVSDGPFFGGANKMTSILKGDAREIDPLIVSRLRSSSGDLDPSVLESLLADMEAYNHSLVGA
jgi:hypothetical protein